MAVASAKTLACTSEAFMRAGIEGCKKSEALSAMSAVQPVASF